MLEHYVHMSVKTMGGLLDSLIAQEEIRSGFKITLTKRNKFLIQCGDLGCFPVPLKPFPDVYFTLVWRVLGAIRGAKATKNRLIFNKYYIAAKNTEAGKLLLPREILEKIPVLFDPNQEGAHVEPVLTGLTLESLTALCDQCIEIAEWVLDPLTCELHTGPLSKGATYLACYHGKWNVLDYREHYSDCILWRFGHPLFARNLRGAEIRCVPDIVKSMPSRILSYRFESDKKESEDCGCSDTKLELSHGG